MNMNTIRFCRLAGVGLIAMAVWAPLGAWAEEPAVPQAKPAPVLPGPYSEMADDLKLNAAQTAQLIATEQAKRKALADWSKENEARWTAARAADTDANKSGDKQAAAKAQTALHPIEAERNQLERGFVSQMQAILTPQQRATCECYQMHTNLLQDFRSLNLTPEQQAKIKDVCLGAVKNMEALKPGDGDGRRAIYNKAQQEIVDAVLTVRQRAINDCYTMRKDLTHELGHHGVSSVTPENRLIRDQEIKISNLCLSADSVKSMEELKPNDKDGRRALYEKVMKEIVETVLTAEQRAIVNKKHS